MRVLLILRGLDPPWFLTDVSFRLLYFPFLPRSGGFNTSQPHALGTNFHPSSPLNTGHESTPHHLVLPPSNLLWDWRSHSKRPFHLAQHFYSLSFPLPFMHSLVQGPSPHHQWVTRLSEESLSLPSLDLGEERVNENSHESSEIELRVSE